MIMGDHIRNQFIAQLKEFFTADRQWPFVDSLQDFAAAMTVAVLEFDQGTLENCLEDSREALVCINDVISSNSVCGNALAGWPKGKKLVQDLRLYNGKAILTQQLNVECADRVIQLASAVNAVVGPESLLSCDLENLTRISEALEALAATWARDESLTLPQFLQEKEAPAVAEPIAHILANVQALWQLILEPVLTATCCQQTLKDWFAAADAKIGRMNIVQNLVVEKLTPICCQDAALKRNESADTCCEWLVGLVAQLEKSFGDGKACDGLWKQRGKAISAAIALGSEHWASNKFGESPLVSIEGTCMGELSLFHGSLGDAFHGRSL